tara:strand:+ start:13052 stop:13243 length:192 start_codon:yes stop_codon:yes gene_type:complete
MGAAGSARNFIVAAYYVHEDCPERMLACDHLNSFLVNNWLTNLLAALLCYKYLVKDVFFFVSC